MNFSPYTTKNTEETFLDFSTSLKGLSDQEVEQRQKKHGPNEIIGERIYWWHILVRQFKSSFVYLLLIASGVSFILGEEIEALMILVFVAINAFLGFYQEFRSEKTLKLLKKHFSPQAKVRRNGKEMFIKAKELVPGDMVIVEAGDMLPADLRFISETNLVIDESVLTGESVPIKKTSDQLGQEVTEVYQAKNIGFSSTIVVSGKAEGVVLNIGKETVIGGIAYLTSEVHRESSFEKGIIRFSRFILRLILISIVFVFLANLFIHKGTMNIGSFLIFSIALVVCVIPEALPVVTTVSLSRGALRMAKNKVVVKRLSAIEDLGEIQVLCSDKTGTLTENKLKVAEINSNDKEGCLLKAALASSSPLVGRLKDPFDSAIFEALSTEKKEELNKYKKLKELPFDPERRRNSVLIKKDHLGKLIVKGAPEYLFDLCHNLKKEDKKLLREWMVKEGEKGRRVIAVVQKEIKENHYDFQEEKDLLFLGMISFFDPLKKDVKKTIKQAEILGIKVKILTGDAKEVTGTVAAQIGLIKDPKEVLLGEELNVMSEEEQKKAVEKYAVFARVSPLQKYRIVEILQKKYEVGFLGEGINDAPALKIANVALVVERGVDIAKEAADVILLKKNLAVVINGIKQGREIFANTVKYIKATLISNFGNFYAMVVASLMINFLPMLPLQILLLNLFSDFPMISLSIDNVDKRELRRPQSHDFKEILFVAFVLGLVSSIFDFIIFTIFVRFGPATLQTNWFIGSVLTELVLIFSIRTRFLFFKVKRASNVLIWLSIFVAIITLLLPFTHFGQEIFKFVKPQPSHLFWIFGIVGCYFVVTEVIKLFYYRPSSRAELTTGLRNSNSHVS